MHFVGVDLAWGQRQRTGLAVLDGAGRLVHVSTVRTDDEIAEALAPYVADECLVAIDAPLVVRNPTGQRAAEAALNKDFSRFDAGAHSANTGNPVFDPPRGATLCSRLGLDMNPRSGRARRAIEVYPHPATVALFRLGRTLKYKDKSGRSFDRLRGELLVLMGLVEGLAAAPTAMLLDHPDWRQLVTRVETATRKAELGVVEDQVDAVVCAYVARFATCEPDQVTMYGDFENGYVVTPTLPAGHTPTPRERRARRDPVRAAVEEYAVRQPALVEAGQEYVALVTSILDEAGINYLSVTGRTKSVASFAAKAGRTVDGEPVYADPLNEIGDQVGLRVITYVHSDVSAVADLLASQLRVLDDRDLGEETAGEGRFGYASRHLQVTLEEDQPGSERLRGLAAQVQVRTVLQHAWAEFEHDIRYKGTVPAEHAPDLDRRFTLAAGLLELADREFSEIRDRIKVAGPQQADLDDVTDPRIDAHDLASFLTGQYADAGWSRTDHYAWISGLLLELGITSLDELAGLLTSVDSAVINARLEYKYPPGAVRRLDDALLAVFGHRYLDLHGNAHRRELLATRLEKLRADDGPAGED